ncbi:hypothetical protein RB614_00055 [Phytohabitans sp. ZYX-F-186]|uniref:Lipoprotein n=1 Tax=Phytohabitans maris TaxID=3071409 RepID=A0ABU0Z9B1_9ACTN|nr:hypothetical protein [Phytohabitans sp. ZYX-F-186]MDQ7902912.1 hypothetical protein [Phytohabitans sp. ZYX-F-186]
MSRSPLLAVVVALVLAGAGCSADRPDASPSASAPVAPDPTSAAPGGGSPGGASPGGASPGGASPGVTETGPAAGNAKQVCADAMAAGGKGVTTFLAELGNMLNAAGKGDGKAEYEARQKAEAALATWSNAMKEQAAKATDGRLRTLLNEIGVEVGTMRADIDSVDSAKLDQLQQRLDTLCSE